MTQKIAPPFPPTVVLSRWRRFADADIQPIRSGLINTTFALSCHDGEKVILQRLHPIFAPEVNLDLAAVTEHLADRGMTTPRLLPTDDGALWVAADDETWRALSFVPGIAPNQLSDRSMAREAGLLVGRFHAALADFNYRYRSQRNNVHDTAAHLTRLREALDMHAGHRLFNDVAHPAEALLKASEPLESFDHLPLRHAHGDLKISNLMFDEAGRGVCLIDLDTLTRMRWPLEMGDALRSWCNPSREDQQAAQFDLSLFEAAVSGYHHATGELVTREEWDALTTGVARICLELSCRFFADALNESYFGWNPERYPTRGEHNLARGRAMQMLYLDVTRNLRAAERLIEKIRRKPRD
ncbi:MAG: phosphotransferase [Pseudomonadota bacterium]